MSIASPETIAKRYAPPSLAPALKQLASPVRHFHRQHRCRRGFRQFGHTYPNNVLFVAGLPKSGTTWLERMLCAYPGYHELLIPDATRYEVRFGQSHSYQLPVDFFERFHRMLAVTKMHIPGSAHNAAVLRAAAVPYVVLYRDLRDVAVSYFFYVRRTPWHPQYRSYAALTTEEGLLQFASQTLPDYVEWIRLWQRNHDPALGRIVRYEDLVADPVSGFAAVAGHLGLDCSPQTINAIVCANRFARYAGGRKQGSANASSFFRKGVAGDWVSHFTPTAKAAFRSVFGEFLQEFGYEDCDGW